MTAAQEAMKAAWDAIKPAVIEVVIVGAVLLSVQIAMQISKVIKSRQKK